MKVLTEFDTTFVVVTPEETFDVRAAKFQNGTQRIDFYRVKKSVALVWGKSYERVASFPFGEGCAVYEKGTVFTRGRGSK